MSSEDNPCEKLYQEIKKKLGDYKSDDLKYREAVSDLRGVIEDLEAIQKRESDLICQKVALQRIILELASERDRSRCVNTPQKKRKQ